MRIFNKEKDSANMTTEEEKELEIKALEHELQAIKEGVTRKERFDNTEDEKLAKKQEKQEKQIKQETRDDVKFIEREINLSLINEKINYIMTQLDRIEGVLKQ